MDDSQSSNIFSDTDVSINGNLALSIMDGTTYESLLTKTKSALSCNVESEALKDTFKSSFVSILDDCGNCVQKTLDIISNLLGNPDIQLTKLCEYMENATCILQMLSNFLKNLVEAISISCAGMKTFPVMTGQILVTVFLHCKESEVLYGGHLSSLQTQLKDLFRTCHELQLIYLMILEKHFVFDLSEIEEQNILMEALAINLKIGEIVESLDLKTMAEQWKAYTMICEKYSNSLIDKSIYEECTRSLSRMALRNIETALEENQDPKIVLRALKVSNFILKIVIKMCHIFKNGEARRLDHLVDLLIRIYKNDAAYLLYMKKPPQLIHQMNTNVVCAAEILLSELVSDKGFAQCILQYPCKSISKEDSMLGYIILIISIMKTILQQNDKKLWSDAHSTNLTHRVFDILPYCHVWFNLGLKFQSPTKSHRRETYTLYEHLLTHTVTTISTYNSDQYSVVEGRMYEAILGTDCCTAMFATDLWVSLARMSNGQLTVIQLICLCQVYQKLSRKEQFAYSPQQTYLSKTIELLFKLLEKEDRITIYNHFNLNNDGNIGVWTVLKLRNLSGEVQKNAEEIAVKKLKSQFRKLFSYSMTSKEEVQKLTNAMRLAATCSFLKMDSIEEEIIQAWLQTCPKTNQINTLQGELCRENLWHLEYLMVLFSLTESMIPLLQRNCEGLLKVLHVTFSIISSGNLESKLNSLNLIFKLALYNSPENSYKNQMDSIFHNIFKEMFNENNVTFKNKLYETVRLYSNNTRIKDIVTKETEELALEEGWNYFQRHGTLFKSKMSWKEQLFMTSGFSYTHKCLGFNSLLEFSDSGSAKHCDETNGGNFEIDDVEMFSFESDEPSSKKAKLDCNEADIILKRLENDVSQLEKLKENVSTTEFRNRIVIVCEKLKNIVS